MNKNKTQMFHESPGCLQPGLRRRGTPAASSRGFRVCFVTLALVASMRALPLMAQTPALQRVPNTVDYQLVSAVDASTKDFPYATGWPVALPGAIVGTPVVADVEGDGNLVVVVPC